MSEPTGVIHDIGYQRYHGPRLRRRYVLGTLYLHGLRAAFGLGRGAKAKIFPWLVVTIVGLVAAVVAVIRAHLDEVVMTYVQFADLMSWLVIFFVAVVAPELVSRDVHSGVLPLYFSRPLRRSDYVLAKLAALVTAVWLLLGAPQLLMFVGAAFTTIDGVAEMWREAGDLAPGLLYAAIWALVFGSVGLLVASLTGKRAFAAASVVAVFLMTAAMVEVLTALPSQTVQQLAPLASPLSLVKGVGVWAFRKWLITDPGAQVATNPYAPLYALTMVLLVVGCFLLLLARYRKVAS